MNRLSNLSNRAVLLILIIVALASSGLSLVVNVVNQVDTSPGWWVSWLQNFSTEMFGAFLTFILIELIVGGREKRREEERARAELKERIIRQMGSSVNGEAVRAVEELTSHGWLYDDSLRGKEFKSADLQGAYLPGANLQLTILEYANLQNAILQGANLKFTNLFGSDLQNAQLGHTDLRDAFLLGANLQGARLYGANLQGANLSDTNLRDANLIDANLRGAKLEYPGFNENTVLPDETKWTPTSDLTRFTDPNHPQFWHSRQYRGKDEE